MLTCLSPGTSQKECQDNQSHVKESGLFRPCFDRLLFLRFSISVSVLFTLIFVSSITGVTMHIDENPDRLLGSYDNSFLECSCIMQSISSRIIKDDSSSLYTQLQHTTVFISPRMTPKQGQVFLVGFRIFLVRIYICSHRAAWMYIAA